MADSETRLLMLIDDEPAQSRLISALAARENWRTLVVKDAETAIATLGTRDGMQCAAVILDQWVPGDDACTLIEELKARRPAMPILMLTTSASPMLAVEAMRAGATDYLVKPIAPDRLMQALRSSTKLEAPKNELQPLTEKMGEALDFDAMIGNSPQFRSALAKAAKAARGHGPALIEGERGTGKEMLMRAMHSASPRAKAPLRLINIRSVPANSIESVLFGHEQNAFPGAFERQIGAVQLCDGGTLILDEIDRLDIDIQAKLAEVLDKQIVRPIGAAHGFRVDVRFLCASNLPLASVADGARGNGAGIDGVRTNGANANGSGKVGHFHPDLLAAISQTRISLPPLRDRQNDIVALTRHFLNRVGEQPGLRQLSVSDSALNLLSAYDWPGNVRQLQAVLFRAAVFCDRETLTVDSFPQLSQEVGEVGGESLDTFHDGGGVMIFTADGNLRPLEEIEADVIRLAIGHYRGRMTEVARRLGIGRSTLYRKLGDLGIGDAA